MNGFNAVDIVALVWLLIGLWHGVRQGLAGALLRLMAVAIAVGVGVMGYAWLGDKMAGTGRISAPTGDLFAFFVITAATYVALRLLGLMLRDMMTFSFKGKLEPVGGGLVGLVVSAVVITVLLLVLGQWPNPKMRQWFAEESWAGHLVQQELGPAWQRLEQRYPVLKLPENGEAEKVEKLKDVTDDAAKAVEQTEQTAQKKVRKAKKRVSDAVVESKK